MDSAGICANYTGGCVETIGHHNADVHFRVESGFVKLAFANFESFFQRILTIFENRCLKSRKDSDNDSAKGHPALRLNQKAKKSKNEIDHHQVHCVPNRRL